MSISTFDPDGVLAPLRLWQAWPEVRFVKTPAPCLRHHDLLKSMQALTVRYPGDIHLEEIGRSFLERPIHLVKLGVGDKNVLFWSQMHGDEPSATPALLDMAGYLLANSDQPACRAILESYTLLMIPMLNPDGAEVYERVNAQGIDINRDALRLATPEGRLLKRIRDEYEPMLGLNLHDQGRMTTVGDTGRLATTSVLAVSGDVHNTLTRGRLRSKRACAAIVEALTGFIPGGVARYDESWSPLAFGDNMTAWGTPVVLIECGGLPAGYEVTDLTRLSFVALLTVLKGLAEDDLASYDPQVYEDLPENQTDAWSDVVVRGGLVLQPGAKEAFRSDLAFNYLHNGRQAAGCCTQKRVPSEVFLIGDASCHGAGTSVNANGKILLAAFEVGLKGWSESAWLDQGNLTRLARMGVGTIYWLVSEADYFAARSHADTLAIQGLPRIEVLTNFSILPGLLLSGPPTRTGSTSMSAILDSLGVDVKAGRVALETLWMAPLGERHPSARLCKNGPASFLMVSAGDDGQFDLHTGQLLSVWLDGHEVELN
ncbi:MAG: M14 family zinc carboxypeptidase [Lysobacterales bacterium]